MLDPMCVWVGECRKLCLTYSFFPLLHLSWSSPRYIHRLVDEQLCRKRSGTSG